MRIVLDTNILIAGLLRDAVTRRILLHPGMSFVVPEHALAETERHLPEVAQRMRVPVAQAHVALGMLLERVEVVPQGVYAHAVKDAEDLLRGRDLDDAPFLALALALGLPLWTRDKDLHGQPHVTILTTRDLLERTRPPP